jgi:hypothetical protein
MGHNRGGGCKECVQTPDDEIIRRVSAWMRKYETRRLGRWVVKMGVDGTGSGSVLMSVYGISGIKPGGFATAS